jgi:hypothetical protein
MLILSITHALLSSSSFLNHLLTNFYEFFVLHQLPYAFSQIKHAGLIFSHLEFVLAPFRNLLKT